MTHKYTNLQILHKEALLGYCKLSRATPPIGRWSRSSLFTFISNAGWLILHWKTGSKCLYETHLAKLTWLSVSPPCDSGCKDVNIVLYFVCFYFSNQPFRVRSFRLILFCRFMFPRWDVRTCERRSLNRNRLPLETFLTVGRVFVRGVEFYCKIKKTNIAPR